MLKNLSCKFYKIMAKYITIKNHLQGDKGRGGGAERLGGQK